MAEKTFGLFFTPGLGPGDAIKAMLDANSDVIYWYSCLPFAIFLTSEKTAEELTDWLLAATNKRGRFIFIDLSGTEKNGWLPKDAWALMRNPAFRAEKRG